MNTLANERGWTPFTALQVEYSLIERTVERELLPMAHALELAVTPWAALGGGLLTGKYTRGDAQGRLKPGQGRLAEHNLAIARVVDEVADALGKPSSQVALNWVRQQGVLTIPIVGASKVAQLEESLAALEWKLEAEHLEKLHAVSKIDLGFPLRFLESPGVLDVLYAGTRGLIDNHRE